MNDARVRLTLKGRERTLNAQMVCQSRTVTNLQSQMSSAIDLGTPLNTTCRILVV
jgi:hypothetical protein